MTTPLKYSPRKVGNDAVTPIGYGAMSFGGIYGKTESSDERFKVLDKLYEMGCTNWDTASMYGDSEDVIGQWFKRTGLRDKIFLATKFGIEVSSKGYAVRNDEPFIHEQLETSLKKLQTDHIDLYYVHRTDQNIPIEVTMRTLKGYVEQGKIRYIGLSDASVNTMRRAHAIHPISAIQVEYSPFETGIEGKGGVLETAREMGATIYSYSPNGRGMTTGRWRSPDDFPADDHRRRMPRYSAANFPHVNALTDGLAEVGKAHNATAAQVTIAWLLTLGPDIIPLPGSKTLKYAEENFKSAEITLSEEEQKKIRALVDETVENVDQGMRPGAEWSWVDTPEEATWNPEIKG